MRAAVIAAPEAGRRGAGSWSDPAVGSEDPAVRECEATALSCSSTAAEGEVDRVLSGEVCGEMALLHDAPRNATVRPLTECSLYRHTRDEFLARARRP